MHPISDFIISPPDGSKHYGQAIDTVNGYTVIECEPCGFRHVVPIPTPEQLGKLYEEDFYTTEKPDYFRHVEEDAAWWELHYQSYYRRFEKHVSSRRLLEVGSGPGYFLKCGREMGWDVTGFEPSRQAAEYSRKFGVNVVNELFSAEAAKKLGGFDVVYMNMVIEHVPDPVTVLKDAGEVLKTDGILCVISPNDYNPLQAILREHMGFQPYWVAPPQHINYFNFASVSKLLEQLGFSVIETSATFPMELFLLSGDNYVGNDKLGRACHFKRKELEKNMFAYGGEILGDMYGFMAKKGLGREFIMLAKRKEVA